MGFRHNLYFMLHLPAPVAQAVVRLRHQLNASYRGPSSPMAAERLHVTLVPLGSYERLVPAKVLRIAQLAGTMVAATPFRVSVDTLQSRGPQTEPGSVELAGHGPGVRPLFQLRRHLVEALRQAGWSENGMRPSLHPHITIDYHHAPVGVRRIEALSWDVTEFHLIDSHHGAGHHEVLATWPLLERQASLFN